MSFTVCQVVGGYGVKWKGRLMPGEPWPTEEDAQGYAERLTHRYPNDSVEVLLSGGSKRQRGGPWKWTLPDGSSGVINTSRKADAESVLRYQMKRKRLPKGITWELDDAV